MANILEVFEYNQHFVAMMNIINSARHCHNKTGHKHHKHSDETKKRISDSIKKRFELHPEYRDEYRIRSTGRKFSEESKLKKSKSLKGRVFNAEWRAKLSEAAKRRVARNGGYAIVK